MENVNFKSKKVEDKYNLVLITFAVMGMSGFAQANFLLTANKYWNYKFRPLDKSIDDDQKSSLQLMFTSYFQLTGMGPAVLIFICNLYLIRKFSLNKRVLTSMASMTIVFFSTLVFVNLNTDPWQELFFYFSLITNFLVSVFGYIALGGLFAVQGLFPDKYMTSIGLGQSFGSIVSVILQLISLAIGATDASTGNIFFGSGNAIILVTYVLCIIMFKTEFFNYYMVQTGNSKKHNNLLKLIKKIWLICLSSAINMFTAIVLGPGFLVLIKSQDGNSTPWGKTYFIPVVCFLIYYIGECVGKLIVEKFKKPYSVKGFLFCCLGRLLFIPILLVCNLDVKIQDWPVLFNRDYQSITIVFLFGVTYGYILNLSNFVLNDSVERHESEDAFGVMIIFVTATLSIATGLNFLLVTYLTS